MLEDVFRRIQRKLYRYFESREGLIREARDVLRFSRESIQLIHQKKYEEAWESLGRAKSLIKKLNEEKLKDPRLKYSGFWLDVSKEFAEAYLTFVIVSNVLERKQLEIPDPEALGILEEAWVLGLCETAGELKREIFMAIESNDFKKARKLLGIINEIYGLVSSLLLPNAIIPNLKARVDYLRSILISSEETLLRLEKEYEFSKKIYGIKR